MQERDGERMRLRLLQVTRTALRVINNLTTKNWAKLVIYASNHIYYIWNKNPNCKRKYNATKGKHKAPWTALLCLTLVDIYVELFTHIVKSMNLTCQLITFRLEEMLLFFGSTWHSISHLTRLLEMLLSHHNIFSNNDQVSTQSPN